MRKIFLIICILLSVTAMSQSTGKILIMPKDTSKFLSNTNAQKNTVVSWSDTTISGANIQYLLYCNMTKDQSIRDAINNGCAKIYGGKPTDSSIYSTIYRSKSLISDSLNRFWDSTETKSYITNNSITDSSYIKAQVSDSLKLSFKIADSNSLRNPITLSYFNANKGATVDSSIYSTIFNTKRLIKDSLVNTFKVVDTNTNRNPITLNYFNTHQPSTFDTNTLNLVMRFAGKLNNADSLGLFHNNRAFLNLVSGTNTGDTVGHGVLNYQTSLKQNRGDTNTITNPITLSYFNTYNNKTDSAYIKKIAHDSISVVSIQRATDAGKTTTNVISSSVSVSQINITGGYSLINKNYGDSSYLKLIDSTGIYHSNRTALNSVSGINTGDTVGHGIINSSIDLKVPYLNATTNVNLGTYNYIGNSFIGNQTPTTPTLSRQLYWNDADKTYSINADTINGVTIDIAHEQFIRAVNKTGSQINDGQVVYLSGSQGNRPKAWLARADAYTTSRVIGIATQNIAINAEGSICISGVVHGYNTSAYNDSADLYLSSTVAGKLTDTIPTSPNHVCYVGKTLNSTSNGSILVTPKNVICSDTLFTDNSNAEAPTQKAVRIALGSKLDSSIFYTQDTLVKDPTGFINNDNIKVHYDTTTRKITLSGTFEAYWKGRKISALTNGWESSAHGTTLNKTYYLYYNGTTFIFDTIQYKFSDLQIAYVWYSASDKIGYNEAHGCSMDWQSHELFHRTIGTILISGGDISGVTLNSTTATNRRPVISSALVEDEDLEVTDSAFAAKSYCIRYLTGTGAVRTFTKNYAEIIPVLAANPYYNQNNAGTWQQTLFANNNYGAIFVMAVPTSNDGNSQRYRFEFVQPQTTSTTLLTIQNLTTTSLNMGSNSSDEYIFIGKIIVRYTATDWIIISTEKLTGSKIIQTSATAAPYSATTDGTTIGGNGTPTSPLYVIPRVWADMYDTPIRATSTTFTITGDYSSYIAKGLVIKWTESSTIRCAMVSIPSTFSSPNTTVTLIGDTIVSTGFDASSVKYYLGEVSSANFAVAGVIGAVDTAVSNTFCATMPYRVFGADIWNYKSGSTNNTTVDINKNISLSNAGTLFTVKPTLATTVGSSPTPFTATTYTSLVLGDKVFMDIDAIQTVQCQDLFVKLYILPTSILSKP